MFVKLRAVRHAVASVTVTFICQVSVTEEPVNFRHL